MNWNLNQFCRGELMTLTAVNKRGQVQEKLYPTSTGQVQDKYSDERFLV